MKKFFFSLLFVAATTTISAQLKVISSGNVQIQKSYTDANSALSVGDFPSNYGVYNSGYKIGIHAKEYDTTTTNDCVGIMGESKRGSSYGNYFSVGVWGYSEHAAGNKNVGVLGTIHPCQYGAGICGTTEGYPVLSTTGCYAGYFYGDTYVDGLFTATDINSLSDSRLEQNVISLSQRGATLDKLQGLEILEYNLLRPSNNHDSLVNGKMSERRDAMQKRRHYGVSAQELQQIYPDLVVEGQDGYLTVNYVELVPILIRSIQELKQELDEVKGIASSDALPSRGAATALQTASEASVNVLYQNTPNPFKEKTTIRFRLADDAQNAAICIFDLTGKQLKKLPISSGEASVNVNGWELGEGMYLYTLLVNGQEVDTKRMIITK